MQPDRSPNGHQKLTKKPTFEARAHPPADPAFIRYLEVFDPSVRQEF